jgi:hypothetical protein
MADKNDILKLFGSHLVFAMTLKCGFLSGFEVMN